MNATNYVDQFENQQLVLKGVLQNKWQEDNDAYLLFNFACKVKFYTIPCLIYLHC